MPDPNDQIIGLYETWKRRLEQFFPPQEGFIIHAGRDDHNYSIPFEIISVTKWGSVTSLAFVSGQVADAPEAYHRCMSEYMGSPSNYKGIPWGATLQAGQVMFFLKLNSGSLLECTTLYRGELDFERPATEARETLETIKLSFVTSRDVEGIDMSRYALVGAAVPDVLEIRYRAVAGGAGASEDANDGAGEDAGS
ncbi:hypothetical protein ASPCADRAFT_10704 [Aspergillus carbonarius ITEM 5010]|uniref:Uncharacterized protein n=1 Tax=Aspergillus carbonarius (strain ITEM 5010) TaxID=602072 RepID=A0A1R3R7A4_ASPC5|nr:hypothetical protein ASPCADRAFT_10704 [Aspergillus carbonarius ITEM 5010]